MALQRRSRSKPDARPSYDPPSSFARVASRRGLLLQLLQFFLQRGQARDRGAVGLIGSRLFLYLRPARVGVLFIPRTPSFRIEHSLRGEIVE